MKEGTEVQRKRGLAQGLRAWEWLSQAWNSALSTLLGKGPTYSFIIHSIHI